MLTEKDPSFKNIKFLIIIMQILYLFNILTLLSHADHNQPYVIKTLTILCGGMLIFITVTLMLIWINNPDCFYTQFVAQDHMCRDKNVPCSNKVAFGENKV